MNILDLIPQRPPILMVDHFDGLTVDGVSLTTYRVPSEGLFVTEGFLTPSGVIEHMAQSAAARIGWLATQQGGSVAIGYIGAIGRFHYHQKPHCGQQITTTIRVVQELFSLSLVQATSRVGDTVVAEGELKIFLNDAAI